MNRRKFCGALSKGAGWTLAGGIFVPKLIRGQDFSDVAYLAAIENEVAGGCATSDTAIPHDELLEGFQNGGPENTWTAGQSADVGTDDQNYDTTALTSGKPTGACNRGWRWDLLGTTAGEKYRYWDRGSIISTVTAIDLIFYFYLQTGPDVDGERFQICNLGEGTDPTTAQLGFFQIRNNSGTMEMSFSSATDSAYQTTAVNGWKKITLHLDVVAASSTFAVDASTPSGFTRSATRGLRYLAFGATGGKAAAENATFVLDLICLNTP